MTVLRCRDAAKDKAVVERKNPRIGLLSNFLATN